MNRVGFLLAVSLFYGFGALPSFGHDCCHHAHDGDCWNCDDHCRHGSAARPYWAAPSTPGSAAAAAAAADLRTLEGKITEVVYLPGSTPENGMVEVRLQSAAQPTLVRLAPSGFLKHGGMLLREGETITVRGFPVAGLEGDIVVATEVRYGDKTLNLRDVRGRSAW